MARCKVSALVSGFSRQNHRVARGQIRAEFPAGGGLAWSCHFPSSPRVNDHPRRGLGRHHSPWGSGRLRSRPLPQGATSLIRSSDDEDVPETAIVTQDGSRHGDADVRAGAAWYCPSRAPTSPFPRCRTCSSPIARGESRREEELHEPPALNAPEPSMKHDGQAMLASTNAEHDQPTAEPEVPAGALAGEPEGDEDRRLPEG